MNLIDGGSEYMIKYLADLVQNPGRIPLVGIVLRGLEGTGKNSITELCKHLVGSEHFFFTSDPAKDVFYRFSESVHRKLVINFDEAESKKMFAVNEDVKALITSLRCNYEVKGVQQTSINSFVRVIVTTNNMTPLKISASDRRWAVFNMKNTYIKDKGHWKDFYSWLDKPESIECVYKYLMNVDISNMDLTNFPETDPRIEIKQACLPLEIKWVSDFIVERFPMGWDTRPVSNDNELFLNYKLFLPSKVETDVRTFGHLFKKMNVPGFVKGRNNRGTTWAIDRDIAFRWLREKGYTSETSLYPPINMGYEHLHRTTQHLHRETLVFCV
jgi:hypothetical protein